VPTDIELAGDEEVFAINVHYDTGVLYGEVQASRKITVSSQLEGAE
jgi:hypothetical protein